MSCLGIGNEVIHRTIRKACEMGDRSTTRGYLAVGFVVGEARVVSFDFWQVKDIRL